MTPDIVELINEKRQYKNKDETRYESLKNKIKAKEKWREEECQELNELNNTHDKLNQHKD